jgi:hypothetical protein
LKWKNHRKLQVKKPHYYLPIANMFPNVEFDRSCEDNKRLARE